VPMPRDWCLMAGDIIHNLRSSLDALTYALARANLKREPSAKEVIQIQFPLIDDPDDWEKERRKRLSLLDPATHAVFESLQPYHRGYTGEVHPFAGLRDLSNIDKHRHIVIVAQMVDDLSVSLSGQGIPPGTVLEGRKGAFEDNTYLLSWRFPDRKPHPEVNMEGDLAMHIRVAYGNPVRSGPMVEVLKVIHDRILNDVFPALESFLK
jgi:hypothetical protein